MRRFLTISAAASLALAGLAVASGAPAGAAAGDLSTVSITVSMDLPSFGSDGPVVFQVTDVPVVAGPELTGTDVVSNPSDWSGSVTVDVDNATHHITIATEDSDVFETATVTVTGAGLGAITLVSDNLWETDSGPTSAKANAVSSPAATLAGMPLTFGSTGGTATMSWTADPAGVLFGLAPQGAAVFAWAVPTTPTTAVPTTVTPTTQAVQPLTVVPAFTG